MGYYWDNFWTELTTSGVTDPGTGNKMYPADLPCLSPRELLVIYTEWLYSKGAMK